MGGSLEGCGKTPRLFVGKYLKGYGRYMQFKQYLKTVSSDGIIQQRLEIIKFFEDYGAEATKRAYGYGKSSVYAWKKKYTESRHNPNVLRYASKRPHTVRKMHLNGQVLDFIKTIREHNSRCGKSKIKRLLDTYCAEQQLPPISESLIGKIIHRKQWFFTGKQKIWHNPAHTQKHTRHKTRIDKKFKAHLPGSCVQIDTVVRFDLGTKRYILTAIDLFSRFTFAFAYSKLSSAVALDFFHKLHQVTPFSITAVKTDNGLEFLGEFDDYLNRKQITHYFSYPRTPKSNAFIERFNRTIQEEFIDAHVQLLQDTTHFNEKLIDYLLYYNQVRPHQSLQYHTPLGFLVKEACLSNMSVTSTYS